MFQNRIKNETEIFQFYIIRILTYSVWFQFLKTKLKTEPIKLFAHPLLLG